MTYLQLVQRFRSECGVAGDGPTTVVGQTREMGRLCNWINQSWVEIQETTNWEFMQKSFTFNTVAGTQTYHVGTGLDINLSDFGSWIDDTFQIYRTVDGVGGEVNLDQIVYPAFRDYYLIGAKQLQTARPTSVTVAPDKNLMLGLAPDDIYTVSGEYYRSPQELTLDADVPIMPSRFHMAIVYKAMQKYGLYESAQEQIQAGKEGYSEIINKLRMDQLPKIQYGPGFM